MSSRALAAALLCAALLAGCPKAPAGPCTADSQCTTGRCCSGKCVDTQSSTAHCGACLNACSAQNGSAKCAAGVCSVSCSSGFGDCNALVKDGCETDLTSAIDHCGACAKVCMAPNASLVCDRNQCLQSSCRSGFGDCNASQADGCEVDLKKTLAHCGACAKKCELPEAVAECTQSLCVVATCNAGFGNCDGLAPNGCETDVKTADAHCSACGMACPAGYKCKASKCVAPELVFYGGLLSIQTSVATSQVSAFNVDTHSWSSVATTGAQSPGSRFGHLAVWDAPANRMLVWGGFLSNNFPSDTFVYALDFSASDDGGTTPTWKRLVTTGGPTVTRGLSAWGWDKATRTLYVYGGVDQTAIFDDFWQLDVATLTWTQRLESGGPGRLSQQAMTWDSSMQRVVIGQGTDENFNATGAFHSFQPAPDGGAWSQLAATGAPLPRSGSTFLGDMQPLLIYGGQDEFGDVLDDLFRLDDADGGGQWTRVLPSNPPVARGIPAAASTGGRRFLFGGYLVQSFTATTEVWELSNDAGWLLISDAGVNFAHPGSVFSSSVARE